MIMIWIQFKKFAVARKMAKTHMPVCVCGANEKPKKKTHWNLIPDIRLITHKI